MIKIVDYLNNILPLDRKGITSLLLHKTEVNEKISNHPIIPVIRQDSKYYLSPLGLLNGLFDQAKILVAILETTDEGYLIEKFELRNRNEF